MIAAVDTNVLIYAFAESETAKAKVAARIITGTPAQLVRVPLQAAAEAYAVLVRKCKWPAADARAVVAGLLRDLPAIAATKPALEIAMAMSDRHTVGFWDAFLVASCAAAGCTVLLSEDLQDGRRFRSADAGRSIRIVNPFAAGSRALLESLGFAD
jgi:predicted nucleic acid-binding protein